MGLAIKQLAPDNTRITWTNTTGATAFASRPIRLNGRWVVPMVDIPNGGTGTVLTSCRVELVKATGFAVAVGDNIWWDTANNRISNVPVNVAAGFGELLGRASAAAASGDTLVNVDINVPGTAMFAARVTGTAAAGLAINTGLGLVPRAFSVISRQSTGALRTISSAVLGTGGTAGVITVTTSAGAADDVHDVIAIV